MIYFGAHSTARPEEAEIRQTAQGEQIIYLRRNVVETQGDDDKGYSYDEAVFVLPDDRSGETVSSITANFAEWWAYAAHCHDKTPTADERISDLEDAVMTLTDLLFGGI